MNESSKHGYLIFHLNESIGPIDSNYNYEKCVKIHKFYRDRDEAERDYEDLLLSQNSIYYGVSFEDLLFKGKGYLTKMSDVFREECEFPQLVIEHVLSYLNKKYDYTKIRTLHDYLDVEEINNLPFCGSYRVDRSQVYEKLRSLVLDPEKNGKYHLNGILPIFIYYCRIFIPEIDVVLWFPKSQRGFDWDDKKKVRIDSHICNYWEFTPAILEVANPPI